MTDRYTGEDTVWLYGSECCFFVQYFQISIQVHIHKCLKNTSRCSNIGSLKRIKVCKALSAQSSDSMQSILVKFAMYRKLMSKLLHNDLLKKRVYFIHRNEEIRHACKILEPMMFQFLRTQTLISELQPTPNVAQYTF